MNNNKKLIIISTFLLVIVAVGVAYAMFTYIRTGSNNSLSVGRIHFNSTEQNYISLSNIFPISVSEVDTDTNNVGSFTIAITGDTTNDAGIEYVVSAIDVNNRVNNKEIPISTKITATNLGQLDDYYFSNRGHNVNVYYLTRHTINSNSKILYGYIAKGATGVNGTINIKAYIDENDIAITDTYGIEGGTTDEWVNGRTVFTTSEWSSIKNNPISFRIKVEARNGVWAEGIFH